MDRPLCHDDVVKLKLDDTQLGVVEKTNGEVDTHDPDPGRREKINRDKDISKSAFKKFMHEGIPPPGTVLVAWQHTSTQQLILESKLEVMDRSLLIGDVVKKNVRDAMSGVVINTYTSCTIQSLSDLKLSDTRHSGSSINTKGFIPAGGPKKHFRMESIMKPFPIEGVPASELQYEELPSREDVVVYKDWVGRIFDTTRYISIRLSDNSVVEILEDSADHTDGSFLTFSVGDVASALKSFLRTGNWIYGKYNPNITPIGTVVRTRLASMEVNWLEQRMGSDGNQSEPPALLEREHLESPHFHIFDRTRRSKPDANAKIPSTVSDSDIDVRLNLRVRFKDLSGACLKYDGSTHRGKINRIDRKDTLGFDINVFEVLEFHTDVTVQWQDLSITRERSIDLTPEIAIDDEHDAWPGEVAHLLDLQSVPNEPAVKQAGAVGIIQSVNPSERLAKIRWSPDACVQYAVDSDGPPGAKRLVTGVIGIASGETEEVSLYDIEAAGALNVRRGDIVLIAPADWHSIPPSNWRSTAAEVETRDVDWLGEIVDTPLDGSLTVRLSMARQVRDVNLKREHVHVAIRSDLSDEMDAWDEGSAADSDANMESDEEGMSDYDSTAGSSDEDGSTDPDSDISVEVKYEDENGVPMDVEEVENEDWESESDEDMEDMVVEVSDAEEETPLTSQSPSPPEIAAGQEQPIENGSVPSTNALPDSYLVLSDPVPIDHAFSAKSITENTIHAKRTQKEHKILRTPSNLPSGVYVRTWEERLDLFRVLFVGPADTPYADAPFVVDFFLPDAFPTDPPQAFFHSWSAPHGLGGVGRVNPNLYEDGKICLSLLGTWESGKGSSEGWSAARSTLLQVLVSLQGLVLVREPYYQEAGYMELKGLESSKRASELYSERVFLKARTFVLAALTQKQGLESLEDVVAWLYRSPGGPGLLRKIVSDIEEILRRSEGVDEPVMSKGACISLKRILERLREL